MNKNTFLRMIVTLLVMVASIGAWAQYAVNLHKVQSVGIGYSNLPQNSGCTATSSLMSGPAGTQVTITATAGNGYTFKNWDVMGSDIQLDDANAAQTTFFLPPFSVTIYAVFEGGTGTGTGTDPGTGTGTDIGTGTDPGGISEVTYNTTVTTYLLYENDEKTESTAVGTVTPDPASAKQGARVNLHLNTSDGYTFKEWVVNSGGVTIDQDANGNYYFTMGHQHVNLEAIFTVESSTSGSGGSGTDQPVSGGDVIVEESTYPLGSAVMAELSGGNASIGTSEKTMYYQVEKNGFAVACGQTLNIIGNVVINIPSGRTMTLAEAASLNVPSGGSLTIKGAGKFEGGGVITNNGTLAFSEGTVELMGSSSEIVNNGYLITSSKYFAVKKITGGGVDFRADYLYVGALNATVMEAWNGYCHYLDDSDVVEGKLLRKGDYRWLPDDSKENSAYIAQKDKTVLDTSIDLVGRTFYKDGHWNTLCLPFNYTRTQSLEGAIIRPLNSASISGTTLTLNFGEPVTEMEAGVPYIVKWVVAEPSTITDPSIYGIKVSKDMQPYDNKESGANRVRFIGTYDAIDFDATDQSILFLGADDNLYYPEKGAHIGAFRAYFKIGEDDQPAASRRITDFNIEFEEDETTEVESVESLELRVESEGWWTISGVKLEGKPTEKGVYIHNGKKVVIK